VLIIEDDAQVRRFLRITLEADGIAVLEAARGRDGISQAGGQMPALVMLDLGLPDMDGLDVIRELRSTATMPIIVLSARSAEAQKVAALDAGADDYLTKPFGNLELMARLRVHLRKRARAAADAGAPVRFGDICVDLALRQVTRAGAPVHLTPTEYQLLGVLLRHAGKVLTHTYLLREVWGGGHAERSHYLRIYMANLRRKLERDAARPVYLTTETGVGYRLCLNDERVEELKWT
jgi:two-component system KDP operon response regulator KdpE